MSAYNKLHTALTCPRCGSTSNMEVEIFFGFRNQIDYRIGDRYRWIERKAVQNGGRPPDGSMQGEGYTECPVCDKDFFVKVFIRQDRIEGAEPEPNKPGYTP